MSDPNKEQSLEDKILTQSKDVEKQFAENENKIQEAKVVLQQRMQKRMELKGQHTALKNLLPEKKTLPAKNKK